MKLATRNRWSISMYVEMVWSFGTSWLLCKVVNEFIEGWKGNGNLQNEDLMPDSISYHNLFCQNHWKSTSASLGLLGFNFQSVNYSMIKFRDHETNFKSLVGIHLYKFFVVWKCTFFEPSSSSEPFILLNMTCRKSTNILWNIKLKWTFHSF